MLSYLRDDRVECVVAPLFKMLEALFDLFVPLLMADIIDTGIASGDTAYILRRCALMVLLGVAGLACSVTAQYFASKAAVGYSARLRRALFAHTLRLGLPEMDKLGESTLITRLTSDIQQVQNGLNLFLRLFMRSPFVVVGAMVMAFCISWRAALAFAVAIPVLAAIVFGVMARTKPMYRDVQRRLDRVLGLTRENLSGVRVVRAFGREADEKAAFEAANESLSGWQIRVGRLSALTNPLTFTAVNLAIVAILQTGAVQVNVGALQQGDVVALVSYMNQVLIELVKLANLIVQVTKALACAGRVRAALEVEPEMRYPDAETDWIPKHDARTDRIPKIDVETDAVRFDDVSLRYGGAGAESLSHVSFRALSGQTIGVIGGTGSGKTSLVRLIARLYDPTSGEVSLFGRNAADCDKQTLNALVGVVPQRARLFQGSIRSNLRYGNPDATEQEMWAALEKAQAAEFVRKKPLGLDEPVEQGGRNLSGGQRQRLTIARALVRVPRILILDDSASALDFATDAALRKALRTLGETTVFVVSQRAASLRHADLILVLEEGALVGAGTHDDLLERCPVYREIHLSQFKKAGEAV